MKIITWNVNGIRAIVKKEFSASVKKNEPRRTLLAGNEGSGR